MEDAVKQISKLVDNLILDNDIMVFSAMYCPYCTKVKDLFTELKLQFVAFELDEHENMDTIKDVLFQRTNQKTVPNIFIHRMHMGGHDDIMKKYENGTLLSYVEGKYKNIQYDLIVIGGGSGGIAAAKEAAFFKKKVAIFDYVKPSPQGTSWGVGGTCVNVGCIPKKLMHLAAIIGENVEDCKVYGWNINNSKNQHDWATLIANVQQEIKKLNENYLKYFENNKIDYFNAYATFKDIHTICATDKCGNVTQYTALNFILATGGRPHIPDFSGNNYPITSDDIFSLTKKPRNVLIIGGSYIALECAGFLHGLGIECTVMVRSILLRGFDQQIAEAIGNHMKSIGIKFLRGFIPCEISCGKWKGVSSHLKFKVKMKKVVSEVTEIIEDYYGLVFLATGRDPVTEGLGLDKIGVKLSEQSGRVIADKQHRTSCPTVFAVGDIQEGHLELSPLAIKAGQQVVHTLYGKPWILDYKLVPTTVYTPLEYGSCGLSEEEAIQVYGETGYECFLRHFQPYEWVLQNRNISHSYAKLICTKDKKNTVVGFHILGPNAGEITQGFSLALKLKASKSDFEQLVGIHPTNAEIFTTITQNRPGGSDPDSVKDC